MNQIRVQILMIVVVIDSFWASQVKLIVLKSPRTSLSFLYYKNRSLAIQLKAKHLLACA
jgi:hypothetical protein